MSYPSIMTVWDGVKESRSSLELARDLARRWSSHLEVACFGVDRAPVGFYAAELAQESFKGAEAIFDSERGFASTLVQDGSARPRLDALGERWEMLDNGFKAYACCGLTHASVDCARALAAEICEAADRAGRQLG